MDAALDDVFIDEISFLATDGYALTGILFLPRGAKRHAVLINPATAVPRKIYRGFVLFSDDPWATRPAVELLTSGFTAIKPEVLTVKPSDVGAKAIGHFGLFRPEHRDTLWRGLAEWIQGE